MDDDRRKMDDDRRKLEEELAQTKKELDEERKLMPENMSMPVDETIVPISQLSNTVEAGLLSSPKSVTSIASIKGKDSVNTNTDRVPPVTQSQGTILSSSAGEGYVAPSILKKPDGDGPSRYPDKDKSRFPDGAKTRFPDDVQSRFPDWSRFPDDVNWCGTSSVKANIVTPAASGDPKMVSYKKMLVKPDRYDGTTSWPYYKVHFETCADVNGWNFELMARYLAVNLRGAAQQVFGDLSVEGSSVMSCIEHN